MAEYRIGCWGQGYAEIWRDNTVRFRITYDPSRNNLECEFRGEMAILTDPWDSSYRATYYLGDARDGDVLSEF